MKTFLYKIKKHEHDFISTDMVIRMNGHNWRYGKAYTCTLCNRTVKVEENPVMLDEQIFKRVPKKRHYY